MSDCQLFDGRISHYGYGVVYLGGGQKAYAHRIAWALYNGADPGVMQVLHTCDVRSCVNPEHLFLGSMADNMADKLSKNRQASGERAGGAKLTMDHVHQIRLLSKAGYTTTGLSELYGVCVQHIRRVVRRTSWRHV